MAPYAICHLKLAIEIGGEDRAFALPAGERLSVFLTNSLEEAHEAVTGPMFAAEIAREAREADAIKRDHPVMVVIGNPPYLGHSANKGKWIKELIEAYKRDDLGLKKPGQAKWLSDDYVKFIRFAQWRINRTGYGVLGFVTNHSYLDNPTFRGMRQSLMTTFDEIRVLDLHGNKKKHERAPGGGPDENVFDIQQGVAIAIFVKHRDSDNDLARVLHADLWGAREPANGDGKYEWLSAHDIANTDWIELEPKTPHYLFVPRDEELLDQYEAAWSVATIFSPNGDPAPGIVTTHDQFAISWTPAEAAAKVDRLLATRSEVEARSIWRLCSQKQWQYENAKKALADGAWRNHIQNIQYRPFDRRTTVFDRHVAVHRRERVMRHMLAGPNVGLSVGRAGQVIGSDAWDVIVAVNSPTDFNLFRRGGNCLFPLYRYPPEEAALPLGVAARTPNLDPLFIEHLAAATGRHFAPDAPDDPDATFGPEDVFHYIYAVLHSPEYRRRYADFLKSDFPRIPMPRNGVLFAELAQLGADLASLHLMEADGADLPAFNVEGDNRVERVHYTAPSDDAPGRVWFNGDQHFEGVSPETWALTIGGYRPAEKWLKDRKGRRLSLADIEWYRQVCAALAETPRVMLRIDEVIAAQGGWPLDAPEEDQEP